MHGMYVGLLRLYPAQYRKLFSREMIDTFDQAASDRRRRGRLALVTFAVGEAAGLVKGLISEWMAKWNRRQEYLMPRDLAWPDPNAPADVAAIQKFLEQSIRRMELAIAHHDFPNARFYSEAERSARARLQTLLQMRTSDA